jgi:peptidyl-prolyl cis-trans isomerase C
MKSVVKKIGGRFFLVILLIVFSVGVLRGWAEVKGEQILAKVGNYIITNIDLEEMIKKYQTFRKDRPYSPEEKKVIVEGLIKTAMIVQEAERLKLDKKPNIDIQMRLLKNELLMKEYVSSVIEPGIKVTDAEVENYIKEQGKELVPKVSLTLREIVVKTEGEAKEVVKELKKGVSFSTVAVEKSIAPTRKNGGRIGGPVSKGMFPKEVEEVIFKLKAGEYSEPIKTEQGYMILYLDERKERNQKEVDDLMVKVKEKVEQIVKHNKIEAIMEKKVQELSSKTKIEKYYERIK